MKLLKSENYITEISYNSILIVVDKLTKYLYLILYKKINNAKQIIWFILDRVIKYYKISEIIISDRNKIFINNF